jgi:hypothetical protein
VLNIRARIALLAATLLVLAFGIEFARGAAYTIDRWLAMRPLHVPSLGCRFRGGRIELGER